MAEQPRDIAGMVEKAMGAGGEPVSMEEQLALQIQDDVDEFVQTIKKRIQENPEYQITERSAHLQNMD